MNLVFEVAFFTYLRSQTGKRVVALQMIKLLARPTNNAEKISWTKEGRNFKRKHFKAFYAGLHKIFAFH